MGKLYAMRLHECIEPPESLTQIQRVPGGWIYTNVIQTQNSENVTSVFVPFDNEFQTADSEKD